MIVPTLRRSLYVFYVIYDVPLSSCRYMSYRDHTYQPKTIGSNEYQ